MRRLLATAAALVMLTTACSNAGPTEEAVSGSRTAASDTDEGRSPDGVTGEPDSPSTGEPAAVEPAQPAASSPPSAVEPTAAPEPAPSPTPTPGIPDRWTDSVNGLEVVGDALWIASINADEVIEVDRLTGEIRSRFEAPGAGPDDVVLGPDGAIWWTGFDNGSIGRIADGSSEVVAELPRTANGLAFAADGSLIVSQTRSATGVWSLAPGDATPTLIADGVDVNAFVIADGRLIGPTGGTNGPGALVEVDLATGEQRTLVEGLAPVAAASLGPDGAVYLVATQNRQILRHEIGSGTVSVAHELDVGFYDNLAFAPDGTLYVSALQGTDLTVVAPDGSQTRLPITDAADVGAPVSESGAAARPPGSHECTWVTGPPGAVGETPLDVEVLVDGLEVPWSIAFLPDGDFLVTERPGRLRLVRGGELVAEPVLVLDVSIPPPLLGVERWGSEGGLLGVLLHPQFEENRWFHLFYNVQKDGVEISRIDRYVLADDARSAEYESTIVDDLPAGLHHQGGRMHLGPDGMLYVGVGAFEPPQAQNPDSLAGKLLRFDLDGGIPPDNPDPASPVFVSGIRNTQGFDWFDDRHLAIVDHGPSGGEGEPPNLFARDEINIARAGENLGWPRVYGCDNEAGLVHPLVSFETAVPPTGAMFYRGDLFPDWTDSLLITFVGAASPRSNGRHLQRVEFAPGDPYTVTGREVYLRGDGSGEFGRLRTVVEAPDGSILVMTSNCDNRGECPPELDRILRITPG